MQKLIDNFIYSRMDEVARSLPERDADFALALEKQKALHNEVREIITSNKGLMITAGECEGLRECLEHEAAVGSILQQAMYRQGYSDCVALLRMLGAL